MNSIRMWVFSVLILPSVSWGAFSNVQVSSIGTTTAVVSWNLSPGGTGQVQYGTTSALGSVTTFEPNLLTYHSQKLSGLLSGATYFYRIESKDSSGAISRSPTYTFKTLPTCARLDLTPLTPSLAVGAPSLQFKLTATMTDGSTEDWTANSKAYWSSTYVGIATIDGTTGRATAVKAGSTTIQAYTGSICGITSSPKTTLNVTETGSTITNIATSSITTSGATVSWNVSPGAKGQVEYGTTTSYTHSSTLESNLLTFHSQKLSALQADTLYHYRVKAINSLGVVSYSTDRTFTTTAVTGPVDEPEVPNPTPTFTPQTGSFPGPIGVTCTNPTYFVSPTGNNTDGRTVATAFRKIGQAAAVARAGDEVCVKAGKYRERVAFPASGTSTARIVFSAEPGVVVDGGDRFSNWSAATEVGAGVYKKNIGYEPTNMTWNDSWMIKFPDMSDTSSRNATFTKGFSAGLLGCCGSGGTPIRTWDGIEGIYGYYNGYVYVGFRGGLNPDNEDITFSPNKKGVFELNGKSYITIRGFTLKNAHHAVNLINGASNNIIEKNFAIGGGSTIAVFSSSARNHIRYNKITLGYHHTMDPTHRLHWFLWTAVKHSPGGDTEGVHLNYAGNDNHVYGNHIREHFDGISDFASPGGAAIPSDPSYAQGLRVYNNFLENIHDDALRPTGAEVNAHWHDNTVLKANAGMRLGTAVGPIYIYRNKISTPDNTYNVGECLYFYSGTAGKVYYYHNSCSTYKGIQFGSTLPERGAPNAYFINNLISAKSGVGFYSSSTWASAPRPDFAYNWIAGSGKQSWMDSSNYFTTTRMWGGTGTSTFQVPTGSNALSGGVDCSRSNSVLGFGLPGMNPDYFTGSTPARGAIQD